MLSYISTWVSSFFIALLGLQFCYTSQIWADEVKKTNYIEAFTFGKKRYGITGEFLLQKQFAHNAAADVFSIMAMFRVTPYDWPIVVTKKGHIRPGPRAEKLQIRKYYNKHIYPKRLFYYSGGRAPLIYIDRLTLSLNGEPYLDAKFSPGLLELGGESPFFVKEVAINMKLNTGVVLSGFSRLAKHMSSYRDYDLTKHPYPPGLKWDKSKLPYEMRARRKNISILHVNNNLGRDQLSASTLCVSSKKNGPINNLRLILKKNKILLTNDIVLLDIMFKKPVYRVLQRYEFQIPKSNTESESLAVEYLLECTTTKEIQLRTRKKVLLVKIR